MGADSDFSGFRKTECTAGSPIAGFGSGMTCVACHPSFCKVRCLKPVEKCLLMYYVPLRK